MTRLALAGACLLVASTVAVNAQEEQGQWRVVPGDTLSAQLDCLEAEGRTLISAHRGGPSPGLPENAIPTMDAVLMAIPAVMEVDVAQSPDGVLYLMHDRTLDRTTNGSGTTTDVPWSTIEELFLVDEAGWQTPYRVPTLEETLRWAKDRTVVQIDFKRTASFEDTIAMIRTEGMANQIILIAYNVNQARRLHELAPEMLISFSVSEPGDLTEIVEAGVPADRIVAFTGTRTARPDLYRELDRQDVEVIFGTLGRSPNSIDNVIDRFGTDERYAELSEGGVDVLATDRPREAAVALTAEDRLPEAGVCGVSRAP